MYHHHVIQVNKYVYVPISMPDDASFECINIYMYIYMNEYIYLYV